MMRPTAQETHWTIGDPLFKRSTFHKTRWDLLFMGSLGIPLESLAMRHLIERPSSCPSMQYDSSKICSTDDLILSFKKKYWNRIISLIKWELIKYFKSLSHMYFCHGQDPEDRPWPSGTLSVVLVGVVRNQAVTQGETKLPHDYYTSHPPNFYRFWTPYKMTNRGAD